MNVYLLKYFLFVGAILFLFIRVEGQDCAGPLEIVLMGSTSADTLVVDLETSGISCQSEDSGNITLNVSGGNGGYVYEWFDDPIASDFRDSLSAGNYEITVTDSEGCQEVINASIDLQTPENTNLAFMSGCGNCLLSNGFSDYFFNANNEYIASVQDVAQDNEDLGDTEVCLDWSSEAGSCNGNPHLQRSWTITPLTDNSSCLKLFFTDEEFSALAAEAPDIPPFTPVELIANDALCLTGFSGGLENCDNFLSAKTYAQSDADPLEITLEDVEEGIWSVSVCLDEYATFYFHLCDYALPVNLISFYGIPERGGNKIYWETAEEEGLDYYELQHSRDGSHWKKLKKINAENNINNKYNYKHKNAGSLINYYRLKIVELDASISFSEVIALQSANEARKEQFLPTTFSTGIYFETELAQSDTYDFIFYNEAGRIVYREKVYMEKGYQKYYFELSRLAAGIYFPKVISERSRVLTVHRVVKVGE